MYTPVAMKKAAATTSKDLEGLGFSAAEISKATTALISATTGVTMFTVDGTAAAADAGHPIPGGETCFLKDMRVLVKNLRVYNGSGDVTVTLIL